MSVIGALSGLYGMSAKTKINSDMTNRELIDKVEQILDERRRTEQQSRRKNPSRIMHLEYADPAAKDAFERKRKAILKAIEAIDAQQED